MQFARKNGGKLEIQIERITGSETIEVDRDIRQLDLCQSGLTTITLPNGLTSLKVLYLGINQLTSLALLKGLVNLGSLWFDNHQLTNFVLSPDTASYESCEFLDLGIEGNL